MPIVMKKSDNGFVDTTRKLICLPSYLGLVGERRDALRRAAATASAAAAAALSFASVPAQGNVVNLSNGGVTAQVNTGAATGLDSLVIAGTQQVNQQWIYFRDTSSTSGAVAPINTLNQNSISSSASTLDVTYIDGTNLTNSKISIEAVYGLTGSSTGAVMAETVTATNLSNSTLPLSLIEYSDFDLNATPNNDKISFSGSPVNEATQTDGGTNITVLDEPVTGGGSAPSFYEGELNNTNILTEMAATAPAFTHLNDNQPNPSTEGNVSYAFEWDTTLAASGNTGSSLELSLNWNLSNVPEPTTATAIVGLAAMCGLRRPRRRTAMA